jgi:hypothetical protein
MGDVMKQVKSISRRDAVGMLAASAAAVGFMRPSMAQTPAEPAAGGDPSKHPVHTGVPHPERNKSTGRAQIDFMYSQVSQPARVLDPDNSRPGVFAQTMNFDFGSRAITVMMRYPKDWKLEKYHFLDSDEALFVLDGSLSVNGVEYVKGDYAYLPAGMPRHNMHSTNGGTVLTCYEGEHLAYYNDAPPGFYNAKLLVKHLKTEAMKWSKPPKPELECFTKGALRKTLYVHPETGDTTWLLKVPADDPAKVAKRPVAMHGAVDEVFVIEGEISTPHGVMHSGAFTWRLPGKLVGPLGTRTGFTAIIRSKGGPLSTTWSENEFPIVWDAPYNPDVPEKTRPVAMREFPKTQLW